MTNIKKLRALIRVTILTKLVYTKSFWFNIWGTIVSILVYYYLWTYSFTSKNQVRGFTAAEMTTYVILARTLASQFSEGINKEVANWITKGNILIELLRPISFIYNLFSKKMGETLFFFLFKGIPVIIFSCLFLNGLPPQGFLNFLLFLISVFFSCVILFWLEFIVGILSFYTIGSNGLALAKSSLLSILSGGIVPLTLFPDAVSRCLNLLPFAGMIAIPLNIYLDKYDVLMTFRYLGIQILWIILLGVFSVSLYKRGIKKVIVQGG